MARRKKHEQHENHEAWAIPYGDLVTLLLAFFVVMYSISSVNDGKYRLLSDSLNAAFRGTPTSFDPVQAGHARIGSGADLQVSVVQEAMLADRPHTMVQQKPVVEGADDKTRSLRQMAEDVEQAMAPLIDAKLVKVRRNANSVEIEIGTDILFQSGAASIAPTAQPVLAQLAHTLKPFASQIRVEGHTDDRPIHTAAYASNWELSAGRAASVVHLLTDNGVDPARLAVVAYGEYRPLRPNDSVEARNANRRVVLMLFNEEKTVAAGGG